MTALGIQRISVRILRPIRRSNTFKRSCFRTTADMSTASKTDVVKGKKDDMNGKNVVVTGANSGIGLALSKALVSRGAHVTVAARDNAKGAEAVKILEAIISEAGSSGSADALHLDLQSFKSIKEFVKNIEEGNKPLDILVNNASIFITGDEVTEDGLEVTMQTNYHGPMALMQLLLPKLKDSKPSRVVWTSSGLESIGTLPDLSNLDALEGHGMKNDIWTYGTTKLLLLMACKEMVQRLEGSGVTVLTAWPGIADTGIPGKQDYSKFQSWIMWLGFKGYGQSPEDGAKPLVYACCAPEEDLREKGLGGDVMYGPIHKRLPYFPFKGFPAGTLNAFGLSTELNVTDDTPKNPIVQDAGACKKVYEKTMEILQSKGALSL
ncbi:TPA: hypothetical protein ACH3X3_007742 [Trebouxia sp. C0006]